MAAPDRFPWEEIKRRWEYGTSENKLAQIYGCSRTAIQNRRHREGWERTKQARMEFQDRVVNRLANVQQEAPDSDEARQLQAEADMLADMLAKHRQEWRAIRQLLYNALKDAGPDPDDPRDERTGVRLARADAKTKVIKRAADAMRVMQSGERLAWGIGTDSEPGESEIGDVIVEMVYVTEARQQGQTFEHEEG